MCKIENQKIKRNMNMPLISLKKYYYRLFTLLEQTKISHYGEFSFRAEGEGCIFTLVRKQRIFVFDV